MAKAGQDGLEAIVTALPRGERKGVPPVHLWNPPFCGDLDMRIARDGTWFYQKTPIGRPALVRLFASVLKREDDKYFLVTPVEKVGIIVEDAPFLAVELKVEENARGPVLNFRTNVDDWVAAGPEHALRFETEAAYRRPQALSARAPRSLGESDAGAVLRLWSSKARNARSAARRCSASPLRRLLRHGGSQRRAGVRLMDTRRNARRRRGFFYPRQRTAHARDAGRPRRSQCAAQARRPRRRSGDGKDRGGASDPTRRRCWCRSSIIPNRRCC